MMKIIYSEEFKRKSELLHYPMKGYWIQFGQKLSGLSLYHQWKQNNSKLYACNTFITEERCRISFRTDNQNDIQNVTQLIYLFALDLNVYRDMHEFDDAKDDRIFSQLAGVIDLGVTKGDVINKNVTTIFELGYIPKCSFLEMAEEGQVQVSHYNSDFVGKSTALDPNLKVNQFIGKESGIDYLKERIHYYKPSELMGTMCIRKSGKIQL